ncbi:carboxypeptidase M32 [Scopulibacillus cellulosilyticus]|uniref:Metal-dependent carboxypeptidase n=1 Tax=Scopulibacillus cellulosilyticus TaxID=2665665 RepID=A0ABW2PTI3_9BACL
MLASIKDIEKGYFEYVKKIMDFEEAISLMAWDLRTGAPKKGAEQRSEVIGTLSGEVFQMSTSEEMKYYIDALTDPGVQNELSEKTRKSVAYSKREYDKNVKIPEREYKEYVILQAKTESLWEEAKEKADFNMLKPYLEKIVDFKRRFIEYWGCESQPYDKLLDLYEPGVTVSMIDKVFGELREQIVPLVQEIAGSRDRPETSFLFKRFSKEKQRAFSLHILREMGYDFDAGRLDETGHPFAISLNPGDVRVTNHYDENDFRTAVFGTIHEGGHALYEQHISKELIGTPLCSGTSMGIHESQSLFFENFVGRHHAFWEKHYDSLKQYADGQFDHVSLEDFYRAINISGPSLIRLEADELTYPLHIIVRYEIEKALFNDGLEVSELPEVWNGKYEEYLGLRPANDREGVLQDIHWSGGDFGYFPSYALGYLYAAQFKHSMLKDIPRFNELLKEGNIKPIREWLTTNIHQFGRMQKPIEILKDATGEELNAKYLVDYLSKKYRSVYELA